jgi:replicative superfamily II helicase
MKTVHDYYKEMNSDEDQKKISLTVLAEKMGCMPWQVKDSYKSQLSDDNFTKSELIETAQQWKLKKAEEGKFFGINPENTSAAHLERWTNEYLNENY